MKVRSDMTRRQLPGVEYRFFFENAFILLNLLLFSSIGQCSVVSSFKINGQYETKQHS